MGQLERYGLYVLCLVIFLILGIAIWGDDEGIPDQGDPSGMNTLEATSGTGPEVISADQLRKLEEEANRNEVIKFIHQRPEEAGFRKGGKMPFAPANPDVKGKGRPGMAPVHRSMPKVSTRKHEVQDGEYLTEISLKYYGTRHQWRHIMAANPGVTEKTMRAGTVLTIPPPPVKTKGKSGRTGPAADKPGTYTVRRGDTPGSISQKFYKTTRYAAEIMRANNISDPTKMRRGAVLKIPSLAEVKGN